MFSLFKRKQPIKVNVSYEKLRIGDLVELKFHDPRTLGILTENSSTYTRFNPGELDGDRIISGTVENLEWQENIGWIIKVATFQKDPVAKSRYRSFLFLENEIDYIKLLH